MLLSASSLRFPNASWSADFTVPSAQCSAASNFGHRQIAEVPQHDGRALREAAADRAAVPRRPGRPSRPPCRVRSPRSLASYAKPTVAAKPAAFRVERHDVDPRSGPAHACATVRHLRNARAKASWVASSARPRSPTASETVRSTRRTRRRRTLRSRPRVPLLYGYDVRAARIVGSAGSEPAVGIGPLGGGLVRAGRPADRSDEPQVGELALDDGLDLLGQVRLAGRGGALEDVVDGLAGAEDDRRPAARRRAVDRHALALEELELEVEDAPDVVRGQRRGDDVRQVPHDPVVRVVGVEDRGGRLLGHPRRLAEHEHGRDREHQPDDDEPDDQRHGSA